MYHQTGIKHLSPVQVSKLLNGHRVIVKHGSGHNMHLSEEQHKHIMRKSKLGKGHTIQLDPYQLDMHQHLSKHHGHGEGEGMHKHHLKHHGHGEGEGMHKHHLKHHGHGEGTCHAHGEGHRHGVEDHVFKDLSHFAFHTLAPAATEIGKIAAISALGLKKQSKHHVLKLKKSGLSGGALEPAGYGEGASFKKLGGALYAAGYKKKVGRPKKHLSY